MIWLANTFTEIRGEREGFFNEWERDYYLHRRAARRARAEAFAGTFALIGRVFGFGVRFGSRSLAVLARKYRRGRIKRVTIRELSALSDYALEDIGVIRSEIPAIAAALTNGTMENHRRTHGPVTQWIPEMQDAGKREAAESEPEWRRAA